MNPKIVVPILILAMASIVLVKVVGGGLMTAEGQLERGHELLQEESFAEACEMFNGASQRFENGSDEWFEAAKGRSRALAHTDAPQCQAEFLGLAKQFPDAFVEQDYMLIVGDLFSARAYTSAHAVADGGIQRWPESEALLAYIPKIRAKAEALGNTELTDTIDSHPYAGGGGD